MHNMEYWNTQMKVHEVEQKTQIIYIKEIKICVTNTAVKVEPTTKNKTFKENLCRGGGVLVLGAPVSMRFLNLSLHSWILQCNHRTPSTQIIWITVISISIRIMIKSKDKWTVIEQQPDPSPNVTKSSDIFLTPRNDDMVKHAIPINKWRAKENFTLDFEYAHKKSCIIYSPQEDFIPAVKTTPELQLLGFFFKEVV